jgi:outer membrane protein insertion porin family
MPPVEFSRVSPCRAFHGTIAIVAALAGLTFAASASAQFNVPTGGAGGGSDPFAKPARDLTPQIEITDAPLIADVLVVGNKKLTADKVLSFVKTRKDRHFDPEQVEADVRTLMRSERFRTVKPYVKETPGGMVVTFEVVEQPSADYVKFVGNRWVTDRSLGKEVQSKAGDPIDRFRLQEDLNTLTDFYKRKGFPNAEVDLLEGDSPEDQGIVFTITEGPVQRIWETTFEGNEVASDARLQTLIESKPGYLMYIAYGIVDEDKLDQDVQKLTDYYRGLGYFRARVGREVTAGSSDYWRYVKFVIDEGPRYKLRNVEFVGNQLYTVDQLESLLELKQGQYVNQNQLELDANKLRDLYGSQGYIAADVQPQFRFLEEYGQLDLVYTIQEGAQYRVGRVNVHIDGNSATRLNVVRNRIDLQPGDIIDIRKVRESERRLRSSQLFVDEPARGVGPQVTVKLPEDVSGTALRKPPVALEAAPPASP